MHLRPCLALVLFCLGGSSIASNLAAQELTAGELARVDDWYRRTVLRTSDGQWGIVIGTMNGQVLWSLNPELELIPASTAKLFTTGFTRARAGGGARISTRVIGRGGLGSGRRGGAGGCWTRRAGGGRGAGSWSSAATRHSTGQDEAVPACVSSSSSFGGAAFG